MPNTPSETRTGTGITTSNTNRSVSDGSSGSAVSGSSGSDPQTHEARTPRTSWDDGHGHEDGRVEVVDLSGRDEEGGGLFLGEEQGPGVGMHMGNVAGHEEARAKASVAQVKLFGEGQDGIVEGQNEPSDVGPAPAGQEGAEGGPASGNSATDSTSSSVPASVSAFASAVPVQSARRRLGQVFSGRAMRVEKWWKRI